MTEEPVTKRHRHWVLADGHVHIYRHFSKDACFEWAQKNFAKAVSSLELSGKLDNVLFLAESSDENWFFRQHDLAFTDKKTSVDDFRPSGTEEANSLIFSGPSGEEIIVIAGRQIVSMERLEVLALGLHEDYPDGRPLQTILADLGHKDCLAVLPWGVGKWLGKRGRLVASIFTGKTMDMENVFPADSGNRPVFWPLPGFFKTLGSSLSCNPAGSDPLPLPNQERRIGSYGFIVQAEIDHKHPFHSLKAAMTNPECPLKTFGKRAGLLAFFLDQIAIRLNRI